ncbi:MAG: hypothetical protein ABL879_08885 [Devosia sp.]
MPVVKPICFAVASVSFADLPSLVTDPTILIASQPRAPPAA